MAWPARDKAALCVCVRHKQLGPYWNTEGKKSQRQLWFHHSGAGATAGRTENEERGREYKMERYKDKERLSLEAAHSV